MNTQTLSEVLKHTYYDMRSGPVARFFSSVQRYELMYGETTSEVGEILDGIRPGLGDNYLGWVNR